LLLMMTCCHLTCPRLLLQQLRVQTCLCSRRWKHKLQLQLMLVLLPTASFQLLVGVVLLQLPGPRHRTSATHSPWSGRYGVMAFHGDLCTATKRYSGMRCATPSKCPPLALTCLLVQARQCILWLVLWLAICAHTCGARAPCHPTPSGLHVLS
jgi:hypothetical protein